MGIRSYFYLVILANLPAVFTCQGTPSGEHTADSLKAIELYRKGVSYGEEGNPEESLRFFEQSLVFRKRVFGERHYRLGSTYMGMAIQYKNLRQLDNAYNYYRMAEEMFLHNAPENDSRLGDIYSNIGNYFQIKGDLSEAIRYQERAVLIYENSDDSVPINSYLSAIYNLANSYHLANSENDALKLVLKNWNKGTLLQKISYMNLMASIYGSLKNFDKAISIHHDIIKILKQNPEMDERILADQFISFAGILNSADKQDSALLILQKAEEILKIRKHNEVDMADIHTIIGDSYTGKSIKASSLPGFQAEKGRNLSLAAAYYHLALDDLAGQGTEGDPDIPDFRNRNYPVQTLRIMNSLGETYRQLAYLVPDENREKKTEHLNSAIRFFSGGSDLTEYLRTSFISEESKLQFTSVQEHIFKSSIAVAYDLYRMTGNPRWAEIAFQNSERNKAISLQDQINEIQSRFASLTPDSLTRLENKYNTTLSWYREKLYDELNSGEPDSISISIFKAKIFENEQNLNRLRLYLEEHFQEYYRIKYSTQRLSFSLIQKQLKPGEVVVSYSLIQPEENQEGSLYVFTITKKDFRFSRQTVNPGMIDDIRAMVSVISSSEFYKSGLSDFRVYCESAFRLYRQLILPFENELRNRRITIIPDGLLCYLPFEALLTGRADTTAIHYHDLPYFILKNSINYSYSASLLYKGFHDRFRFGKRALAFTPIYPAVSIAGKDTFRLIPIPGIYEEAAYLAKKMKTVSFTDQEATELSFRKLAGEFRILHLATHTIINDSLPMFSRLAFYPVDRDSIHNDGWLTTSDIYNLDLTAEMTVLSACRSGGGILRKGEGIMSLAHGFFYAGCPAVLMSLWDVEDKSGAEIIKTFYHNILHGKTKAEALQNAKINYLKNANPVTSHPHFWLAFITIGDPKPLFMGDEKYLLLAMVIILGLIIRELIRKKTSRQKPAGINEG